jgi:hypothetical protein
VYQKRRRFKSRIEFFGSRPHTGRLDAMSWTAITAGFGCRSTGMLVLT